MTSRERVLATSLVVMLGIMGGGLLFHMFVYQPISDIREELAQEEKKLKEAQEKRDEAKQQIEAILHVDPRLTQWQKISLPPRDPSVKAQPGVSLEEQQKKHVRQLQAEYEQWLSAMLVRNKFSEDTSVTTEQADRRTSPILRAKEPIYERLTFKVTGRATLKSVMDAMKEFYKTNLLHQVRNLTMTVAQQRGSTTPLEPGSLDVIMRVEALMVNGAEDRASLMPSEMKYQLQVLATPERGYDLMAKRNMFFGISPSSRSTQGTLSPEEIKVVQERQEILRFVKLTMLCFDSKRNQWEGTFYNQAIGGSEVRFDQRPFRNFEILGQGETVLLEGKVVFINEKQVVFKEGEKFYRLRCGEFIFPAIREALTAKELKELGISP